MSKPATSIVPVNSKDLPGFRKFLTAQRDQANSIASTFSGPLKTALEKLVADINVWLESLPKDDAVENWSLESQLSDLFNLLTAAQAATSLASLELSKATDGKQLNALVDAEITKRVTAGDLIPKAAVETRVTEAVTAKISAGELISKDMHTQLCSEAKTVGYKEGESAVRTAVEAERKLADVIDARKSLLQQNSLPLPDATIIKTVLGDTEEGFAKRKAEFEARKKSLEDEGFQINNDEALANLWLDDATYGVFRRAIAALPGLKFKPNPLAAPPTAENKPAETIPACVAI